MKIITYNLYFGGKKGNGNHWKRMMDEFSPDLVLAQESFNPQDYFPTNRSEEKHSIIWSAVTANWGSVIMAVNRKLTPISVPGFEGWVVGAKTEVSIGGKYRPLSIFSIHTPTEGPDEKKMSYEKKVQTILDRISDVVEDTEMLIAGDFNINTAVRHPTEAIQNKNIELDIIDRLRKEFGLSNCWQAAHPNTSLPQTLRWCKDKNMPYHCDGLFVPHSWLRYLETCDVVADGWTEMSDHNPIVATFSD